MVDGAVFGGAGKGGAAPTLSEASLLVVVVAGAEPPDASMGCQKKRTRGSTDDELIEGLRKSKQPKSSGSSEIDTDVSKDDDV